MKAPAKPWQGTGEGEGLLGSLGDLSLRSSLVAICLPIAAVAWALAAGRPLDGASGAQLEGAALAAMVATFVLVPMFALTGAATAILVVVATLVARREPAVARVLRAAFVFAVAALAAAMAVAYDVLAVPRITG